MPKLEYRSLFFEEEYHEPEGGYYQPVLQLNYPGEPCCPSSSPLLPEAAFTAAPKPRMCIH